MSNKTHRTLGAGQPKKSKPAFEADLADLHADREFQDRPVRQSFDDWNNGAFVEGIEIIEGDDVEAPPEQTFFITEGGFVRIIDSEGNCETYDPYLPENAMRVLQDWMGDLPISYYSDDDDE